MLSSCRSALLRAGAARPTRTAALVRGVSVWSNVPAGPPDPILGQSAALIGPFWTICLLWASCRARRKDETRLTRRGSPPLSRWISTRGHAKYRTKQDKLNIVEY